MTTGSEQEITFFIDRCLGKKLIATAFQSSGIAVEIHDDHFAKDAQDVDWLPEVGKQGWVILTKDARIGKNHLERMAVTNAGISMFTLASQNLSGKEMADIFLGSITKMQEFVRTHPAPFIAKVYRDGRVEMWKDAQTLLDELG
jgi:predicted nuclease of predicted toxin-antitoxin system